MGAGFYPGSTTMAMETAGAAGRVAAARWRRADLDQDGCVDVQHDGYVDVGLDGDGDVNLDGDGPALEVLAPS
ncbi:MAG: hypothetical protein KA190_12280, partial [Kofleriaceae bacterium]|nr:hypothetical protein [Kofleriaceae bacterium]